MIQTFDKSAVGLETLFGDICALAAKGDLDAIDDLLATRQKALDTLWADRTRNVTPEAAEDVQAQLTAVESLDRRILETLSARKDALADEAAKLRKGRRLVRSQYL